MYKVLVVGPSWLGDLIMTQSLLKILHKQGKTIEVLAPKWNHGILECMPEVSKAIEMPFDHGELKIFSRYSFAKELKAAQYDECIVVPNSFKSALIPFWAKIPKRTGWLGEFRYGLLNNTQKLNKQKLPLMVQRLISLAYFGQNFNQDNIESVSYDYPRLVISKNVKDQVRAKFNLNDHDQYIALAPGAAYGDTKRWPAEYFAEIASKKIQQGYKIILLGSPKDREVTDKINHLTEEQCINLAGQLALPETVAIISLANALVSNDSGLLHVAAALDIPLIGIYGSTSPDFTPPLIEDNKKEIIKSDLSCSPCFKQTCKFGHLKCLYNLTPSKVNQSLDKLGCIEIKS